MLGEVRLRLRYKTQAKGRIVLKKASLVLIIVALSISALTLALTVLELFYKKTTYIDSDNIR